MDIESRLRLERDLRPVEEYLEATGGTLVQRDEDPPGLYWVVIVLDKGPPFIARLAWAVYPARAPSVLFANEVGGTTTDASAWPNASGYRAPNDVCKPFTAEGQQLHPKWAGSPHAWRPDGNPFLYVVETIDRRATRGRSTSGMTALILAHAQVHVICDEVRRFGARELETGGFLLTSDHRTVSHVALAGAAGIERDWGRFVVRREALDQLFTYAEDRDLRVAAMFHSHQHEAFLSPIDRTGGINMAGFTSMVIPTFEDPPTSTTSWGFWIFEAREWCHAEPWAAVGIASVAPLRFDAKGVRDA